MFGVEHNARVQRLLVAPERVAALLDALPALRFVWDVNHTHPDDLTAFRELAPRLSLVHVSDTPLPETNHHLPLGRGNVDFSVVARLDVPLILEIGGLPMSGGYGLDTDDALEASLAYLRRLTAEAPEPARGHRTRP
jgi:sugar phosphate isomerase/epimerase